MAENFVSLQSLNEYKGTWGVEFGSKSVTVVAPTMEQAANILNTSGGDSGDPISIQCIKQKIQVKMPEIFVSFNTVTQDETGLAQSTCFAYPQQYTLRAGTRQVFTAVAGEGFKFIEWRIDGVAAMDAVTGELATTPVSILEIPAAPTTIQIQAVFQADAGVDEPEPPDPGEGGEGGGTTTR